MMKVSDDVNDESSGVENVCNCGNKNMATTWTDGKTGAMNEGG